MGEGGFATVVVKREGMHKKNLAKDQKKTFNGITGRKGKRTESASADRGFNTAREDWEPLEIRDEIKGTQGSLSKTTP